jgi:hypothetical protein
MKFLLIALVALPLAGCAGRIVMVPVSYSFTDRPEASRVELAWRNDTGKPVCMSKQDWPERGELHQSNDRVFLVVGDERFPIADLNQGVCVSKLDDCDHRIEPGQQISGFVNYQAFGLPAHLRGQSKKLEFIPVAFYCR